MLHKFEGIGATGAAMIMAGLASYPPTVFLTTGIQGKIIFFFAKLFCMQLASMGLIVLNVGAAKVEVLLDQGDYDGSVDKAEEIIKKIRSQNRELTEDEIKAIDTPVIDAFRKFAGFGRMRDKGNT